MDNFKAKERPVLFGPTVQSEQFVQQVARLLDHCFPRKDPANATVDREKVPHDLKELWDHCFKRTQLAETARLTGGKPPVTSTALRARECRVQALERARKAAVEAEDALSELLKTEIH